MEDEIRAAIRFFGNYTRDGILNDGDKLLYSGGLLITEGCEGDFGCCSTHIDIMGLMDTLSRLIGDEVE